MKIMQMETVQFCIASGMVLPGGILKALSLGNLSFWMLYGRVFTVGCGLFVCGSWGFFSWWVHELYLKSHFLVSCIFFLI